MDSLEKNLGLHQRVEILYVVNGYIAQFMTDDGDTEVCDAFGNTIQESLQELDKNLKINLEIKPIWA